MTIYLTKNDGDYLDHFRVTIEPNGIMVVAGRCYHYALSLFHGIGLPVDKVTEGDKHRVKQLADTFVQRQIDDGYRITPFVACKENTLQVYDNAKFHYHGNFPEGLDRHQAFVHTGFFLGWLIDRQLINADYFAAYATALNAYHNRQMTGPELYEKVLDGQLAIEMLSETGNRFAIDYFDFTDGQYIQDYCHTLTQYPASVYAVEDNWTNYAAIKLVLDFRFRAWQQLHMEQEEAVALPAPTEKRPWWKRMLSKS